MSKWTWRYDSGYYLLVSPVGRVVARTWAEADAVSLSSLLNDGLKFREVPTPF